MNSSTWHQLLAVSFVLLLSFPTFNLVYGQQKEASSGDWTRRELIFSPSYLVENTVSEMQHEAGEEELPFDALLADKGYREPLFITAGAARDDVERLFYLLENGYAGYGYFKDKGDFQGAKEGILAELDGKIILRGSELTDILYRHLKFLHDCHLSIGGHRYGAHRDFWYSDAYVFRQEPQGYSISIDDEYQGVVSINGENPEGYMFPSLYSNGEAVPRIGVLSPEHPAPLELVLEDRDEHLLVELVNSEFIGGEIFAENVVGGVPVLRMYSFSDHHKEYIDEFLKCATKYKDAPCLVVDIRGNGGGNTMYARQWVTSYTGHNPGSIQIYSELVSETSMMGRANYFSYLLHNYPELKNQGYPQKVNQFRGVSEMVEEDDVEAHWSSYVVPSPLEIENNKTLIVLVDSYVGSAAEGFLCYLQQVDNVVLVGENSGGALTYGQMTMHLLPNSRLQVMLPISLNVFTDNVYREELGFYPDYWVPAGNTINTAVAAVRSGEISTSKAYMDEVSMVEFIPQTPPVEDPGARDVLPVLLFVFYGGVIVFFNRSRGWNVFLAGGVLAGVLWYVFSMRNPALGYVFLFTSLEYLVIAVYKRWKNREEEPIAG